MEIGRNISGNISGNISVGEARVTAKETSRVKHHTLALLSNAL